MSKALRRIREMRDHPNMSAATKEGLVNMVVAYLDLAEHPAALTLHRECFGVAGTNSAAGMGDPFTDEWARDVIDSIGIGEAITGARFLELVAEMGITNEDWKDENDFFAVRWNGGNLAACLRVAAQFCAHHELTVNNTLAWNKGIAELWTPGCQRMAPGWSEAKQ